MTTPLLQATEVSKVYTLGERQITVLSDVSLSAAEGEFVVIAGSSGSGKSTLLSLLSGLDAPTSGRITINGHEINGLSEEALAPLRNELMGFVFQAFHLVPSLTALENVMFPAELRRDPLAREKAEDLLGRVGLAARAGHFPHQLSGGEKQRVALCRALVNRPRLLFADEPTGNLDSVNGRAIMELLLELRREHGATLVLVTHNEEIARRADRILHLQDGKIVHESLRAA